MLVGHHFRLILISLFNISLFVLTSSAFASAATHFVRAGATGSGSGSDWTNACTGFTGSCAPGSLVRGDTYYVAAGSYASVTFNRATSGSTLITIQKATVADHGTSTGWADSYAGVANFSSQVDFETGNWVFDGAVGGGPGSWQTGFGFKITTSSTTPGLRTAQVDNITIRHVEVQGNLNANGGGSIAQDGLASYGGTNVTLSYYYIHDMGRCIFFLSTQTFVAEYGYTGKFTGTDAQHSELASIWGFAIPSNGVTFRYNVFTHTDSTGGLMFDNEEEPTGAGMKVYGNVFYRPTGDTWVGGNGVIGGWTGGNGEQFHNVLVYNNTFINVNIAPLSGLPNVFSGNVAYNNIFYNSESPDFSRFTTHDYNHFINSGGTHSESNGTSATSGDPFVDETNLDFRLTAATAAGISLPAPYNSDPMGILRSSDGVWDRGAFEYNGAATSTRPAPPTNLTAIVR
jgi:hypothetical protein